LGSWFIDAAEEELTELDEELLLLEDELTELDEELLLTEDELTLPVLLLFPVG
jgi:hypothetical protein